MAVGVTIIVRALRMSSPFYTATAFSAEHGFIRALRMLFFALCAGDFSKRDSYYSRTAHVNFRALRRQFQ